MDVAEKGLEHEKRPERRAVIPHSTGMLADEPFDPVHREETRAPELSVDQGGSEAP